MPLTRSAVDSDNEQSDMDNQPETASGSSTNMEALLALLQQQTERLAQQQADRNARQADRDARQEERDARLVERKGLHSSWRSSMNGRRSGCVFTWTR